MSRPAAHASSPENRCFDESFLADCDKRIEEFFVFWKSKCTGHRLPSRANIDPVEIVALLPYVTLVDVVQPGPEFVYRLVGAHERRHRGANPTGKSLDDAYSGLDREYCYGNYRYVAGTGQHLFDSTPEPAATGELVASEVLFVPLADDGETVDTIMVCAVTRSLKSDEQPALSRDSI